MKCRNEIEFQYFQLYKSEIAERIGGSFQNKVWAVIMLQACQEEGFVLDMLLAISGGMSFKTASQQGNHLIATEHSDFSVNHYQKALQGLSHFNNDSDKNPRNAIMACLLITCFEALSGNVLSCLTQAQTGHDVLQNWLAANPYSNIGRVGISSPAAHVIEHDLVQAAFFFDTQLLQHFDSRPIEVHQHLKHEGRETIERMPHNFTDVDEARAYWMLVQRRAAHFVWETTAATSGNDGSTYAESTSTMTTAKSGHSTPSVCGSEKYRTNSTSVPNSYMDMSSNSRSNSASTTFDEQEAGQQLLGLSTVTAVHHHPSTFLPQNIPTEHQNNMLFDPMFNFLTPGDINATHPTPSVSHIGSVSAPIPLDIGAEHQRYSADNLRWRLSFSHLYSRLKKSSNPSLITAANILFIQSIASEIQLSSVLTLPVQQQHKGSFSSPHNSRPPPTTSSLSDFREVVTTSKAVVEAKKKEKGGHAEFVLELGITQALYTVVQLCSDAGLRQEAVEVLRWYNCREGAWDCLGLVDGEMVGENMVMEMGGGA